VLAVLKSTVDWTVTVVTVLGMLDIKVDVPDELVWSGSVLVEDGTGPDTTVVRGPIVEVTITVSMATL